MWLHSGIAERPPFMLNPRAKSGMCRAVITCHFAVLFDGSVFLQPAPALYSFHLSCLEPTLGK